MGTATSIALADLAGSVGRLPLAVQLALDDIEGKYRRTVLGPLWITLGQAAMIGGFVVVFSGLFDQAPREYAVYLAAGFPVWVLISSFLSDMPAAFVSARRFLESFDLPWLTQVWRRSISYVVIFFHQIVTLFVVMALLSVPFSLNMLYVFPALAILIVGGTGLGMLLATFGARYRDLQPAMTILASFMFLFSPVLWRAEQLRVNEWAVHFNPFYYCVKLLRDPLLGIAPTSDLWISTGIGAGVMFVLGFLVFMVCRRRLYHWL